MTKASTVEFYSVGRGLPLPMNVTGVDRHWFMKAYINTWRTLAALTMARHAVSPLMYFTLHRSNSVSFIACSSGSSVQRSVVNALI